MLKMTGIKLRLVDDIDMHYLFIEKSMRGSISFIVKRYCKANNEYVKNYDKNEEIKLIMYWDANNLYGRAMAQYLSYDDFEWVSKFDNINFDLISQVSDI